MNDDELDQALRVHYDRPLATDREAALVAQASRHSGIRLLLWVAALAVLGLALWRALPDAPIEPAAPIPDDPALVRTTVWLVALDEVSRDRFRDVWREDALALMQTWPGESTVGDVIANPTMVAESGQTARVEWTDPEGGTTAVELTVTERGVGWHVDVALTLPGGDAPHTWSDVRDDDALELPFMLDTDHGSWAFLLAIEPDAAIRAPR